MSDLNSVNVIGRTVRDIGENDFAYTTNGKARLNLSIAVNDGYGDNKYTNFLDVVVWGKTAENIKPYLAKGKQIAVAGRMRQDRWEKNGQKYSRVQIVAETVQLLGGRDGAAPTQQSQPQQQYIAPAPQEQPAQSDDGYPDDLPF